MKRKFKIGQKLFFVDKYYRTGKPHTFESPITEIGRKYLKVEDFSRRICIDTLQIDGWSMVRCFESKEAYEQEEQKIQLCRKLKNTTDFEHFTLEQLQQIEKLLESFKTT